MEDREIVPSSAFPEGETPSRHELLTMVRQHSQFLREGMVDEDDASDVDMDARFWHEMLDLYFIRGRESKGSEEDDLIFFVRDMSLHGYGFNDNVESVPPLFVRRWAAQLEKVAGENSAEVDWRRSFYLNLIAHTSFTVTVAICSIQDLQRHQHGADTPLSPVYKVVKTVYASPSRVNFQVDFKKEAETIPAYPNICFAIDDFDDTFDAVVVVFVSLHEALKLFQAFNLEVLSESDHCYCVLLNAHGGSAFPTERTSNECFSSSSTSDDNDTTKSKTSKLTLFSGFVSYPMVREAYEAGKSRFGSLLSIGHVHAKTDRLYMRGPGGRGEVEVAVSGVAVQCRPKPAELRASIADSIIQEGIWNWPRHHCP
uniref:Uncharacterized protein KIAA0930 n=1 Tax=Anthurium amnicola TaxID=1678845 RepID=A0A1D1YG87_9ARAE